MMYHLYFNSTTVPEGKFEVLEFGSMRETLTEINGSLDSWNRFLIHKSWGKEPDYESNGFYAKLPETIKRGAARDMVEVVVNGVRLVNCNIEGFNDDGSKHLRWILTGKDLTEESVHNWFEKNNLYYEAFSRGAGQPFSTGLHLRILDCVCFARYSRYYDI